MKRELQLRCSYNTARRVADKKAWGCANSIKLELGPGISPHDAAVSKRWVLSGYHALCPIHDDPQSNVVVRLPGSIAYTPTIDKSPNRKRQGRKHAARMTFGRGKDDA